MLIKKKKRNVYKGFFGGVQLARCGDEVPLLLCTRVSFTAVAAKYENVCVQGSGIR